jgi:hypothetical protein
LPDEQLILEAVWQDVRKVWTDKERWAIFQEMDAVFETPGLARLLIGASAMTYNQHFPYIQMWSTRN